MDDKPIDVQSGEAVPQKRRPWLPWAAGAAAIAIAITVGMYLTVGRPTGLDRDDPTGAKACHQLSDWIHGNLRDPDTGKPASEGLAAIALADVAKNAKTPAIRAAAGSDLMAGDAGALVQAHGGPGGLRFANLENLYSGCTAAGVKMPPYTKPSP